MLPIQKLYSLAFLILFVALALASGFARPQADGNGNWTPSHTVTAADDNGNRIAADDNGNRVAADDNGNRITA